MLPVCEGVKKVSPFPLTVTKPRSENANRLSPSTALINQRDRFEVNPESWTQLKGSLQFSYLGNGDSCLGDIEKIGFIPNTL